jgi:hypothetical protein
VDEAGNYTLLEALHPEIRLHFVKCESLFGLSHLLGNENEAIECLVDFDSIEFHVLLEQEGLPPALEHIFLQVQIIPVQAVLPHQTHEVLNQLAISILRPALLLQLALVLNRLRGQRVLPRRQHTLHASVDAQS